MKFAAALLLLPLLAHAEVNAPDDLDGVSEEFGMQLSLAKVPGYTQYCAASLPGEKVSYRIVVTYDAKFKTCRFVSEKETEGYERDIIDAHADSLQKHGWAECYKMFRDAFAEHGKPDLKSIPADASQYKKTVGEDYDHMLDANGHVRPKWACGDLTQK